MYTRIEKARDDILAYRVSGELSREDMVAMKQEMETAIEAHGKVRLLMDTAELTGAEPGAVWEDLKFTPRYVKDVERLAVVGDRRWQGWVTTLADTFTGADAEFFEASRRDEAWSWVSS